MFRDYDVAMNAASAGNQEPQEDAQGSDDDEDDEEEDAIRMIEDELKANAEKLQALLRDNAAFYEACDEAVRRCGGPNSDGDAQSVQIRSKEEFQYALNTICTRCGIEEVEDEEADDLYDGPMDPGVFYQFAREYFSS